MTPTTPMIQLSVVVPAYRCAAMLRRCLQALAASDLPRSAWELIVVDDGSPDDTAATARSEADLVLVVPGGPKGPGFARNLGSTHARGNVVLFIDADVLVAPDALSRFARLFAGDPSIVAAFGAYDTEPGDPGFLSQYRNLLHHRVHALSAGDAETFWSGCGGVRRTTFLEIGGYDAERYPRPQIEDIDLGYRLGARSHRIVLDPTIQCRHLKRWTLYGMLRTDLLDRALPWMRLLLERERTAVDGPLNLKVQEKLFTALTGLALLALLVAAVLRDPRWLLVAVACVGVVLGGNLPLFAWFARVRGPLFALRVVPFRLLFYVISGIGAAWAIATHRRRVRALPPALVQDSSNRAVA